jgi:hypothetical protein
MKHAAFRLDYFYPFLFAFYPVLDLMAQNIGQITPETLIRPMIFSAAFSLVVWLVTSLLLRNLQKSALLTLTIEILFFSYGHETRLVSGIPGISAALGSNDILALLDLVLLVVISLWIIRTKANLNRVTSFLAVSCIFLITMPLIEIGEFYRATQKPVAEAKGLVQTGNVQTQADKPDIYFIILDAYSREDILKADFGFDNQPFINQLTGLGFQVIPCSRSNYNATALSLSSMLNLNYETTMGVLASSVSSGQNPMAPLIKDNNVRDFLQQLGYNIYTFETGFPDLDWPDTNQFVLPKQASWISKQLLPIETVYIKNTALEILLDSQVGIFKQIKTTVDSPYADHIQLEKYIFNTLPGTANLPGPKFVYAHLILPHKPYVFDAQGNIRTDTRFFSNGGDPINDDFFRQGYIGQVEYANSQISQVLDKILRYSQKPPIIILMGDHGYAWGDTHFENLMAVYLPGNATPFYPTISNVNVFRSIFNDYFGTSYPLLPDASYRIDFNKGVYLPAPETQPDCLNVPQK